MPQLYEWEQHLARKVNTTKTKVLHRPDKPYEPLKQYFVELYSQRTEVAKDNPFADDNVPLLQQLGTEEHKNGHCSQCAETRPNMKDWSTFELITRFHVASANAEEKKIQEAVHTLQQTIANFCNNTGNSLHLQKWSLRIEP